MFVLLHKPAHTSVLHHNTRHSLDIVIVFASLGAFASPEHDDLGLAGVPVDSLHHVGNLFDVAQQNVVVGFCDEDRLAVDVGHTNDRDRFKFVRVQAVSLVLPWRCT